MSGQCLGQLGAGGTSTYMKQSQPWHWELGHVEHGEVS